MKKIFTNNVRTVIRTTTVLVFVSIIYIFVVPVFAETSSSNLDEEVNSRSFLNFFSSSELTISNVESIPYTTQALVTWIANDLATGRVYYSTSSPVVISSTTPYANASIYGNYANSKANIRFLLPNTKYYFKVVLNDTNGYKIVSREGSFSTTQ